MYAVSRKHSTIVWISYVYFYCFEHVVVLVVYMQAHVIAVLVMKIIIIHGGCKVMSDVITDVWYGSSASYVALTCY